MYSGVNSTDLSMIPSVPALLSAAEVIGGVAPEVSGAFLNYALYITDHYFNEHPISPNQHATYQQLTKMSRAVQIGSAKKLERFGDSITLIADDTQIQTHMYRLAYLAYAATSIHGFISTRVETKMQKVIPKINQIEPNVAQQSPGQQVAAPPATDLPFLAYGDPLSVRASNNSDITNTQNKPSYDDIFYGKPNTRALDLLEVSNASFRNNSFDLSYAALTAALKDLQLS